MSVDGMAQGPWILILFFALFVIMSQFASAIPSRDLHFLQKRKIKRMLHKNLHPGDKKKTFNKTIKVLTEYEMQKDHPKKIEEQIKSESAENKSPSGNDVLLNEVLSQLVGTVVDEMKNEKKEEERPTVEKTAHGANKEIFVQINSPTVSSMLLPRPGDIYLKKNEHTTAPTLIQVDEQVKKEHEVITQDFHLVPKTQCDYFDNETRTCWYDRQAGDALTLSLMIKNIKENHSGFYVHWTLLYKVLDQKDHIEYLIDNDNPPWNMVVGSGGLELRLSPLTDSDMDYNIFRAKAFTGKDVEFGSLSFRINSIPVDLGYVYPGEELIIDVDNFICVPTKVRFEWKMEKGGDLMYLPSNMKLSPNGRTVIIKELREDQAGIISCAIYSNKKIFIAKRRFRIHKPGKKTESHLPHPVSLLEKVRKKRSHETPWGDHRHYSHSSLYGQNSRNRLANNRFQYYPPLFRQRASREDFSNFNFENGDENSETSKKRSRYEPKEMSDASRWTRPKRIRSIENIPSREAEDDDDDDDDEDDEKNEKKFTIGGASDSDKLKFSSGHDADDLSSKWKNNEDEGIEANEEDREEDDDDDEEAEKSSAANSNKESAFTEEYEDEDGAAEAETRNTTPFNSVPVLVNKDNEDKNHDDDNHYATTEEPDIHDEIETHEKPKMSEIHEIIEESEKPTAKSKESHKYLGNALLLSDCQSDKECSIHAKCMKNKVCKCLPGYNGNGLQCWQTSNIESSLTIEPKNF